MARLGKARLGTGTGTGLGQARYRYRARPDTNQVPTTYLVPTALYPPPCTHLVHLGTHLATHPRPT